MGQQNYILIGLPKYIGRAMVYLPQLEFFLIMKAQEEEKHLLQEKLQDF